MTSDNALHVACAARGAYVDHSATMLRSVALNRGGRPLQVHYLCDVGADPRLDLIAAMIEELGGRFEALHVPAADVDGFPVQAEFTAAMWYRVLLPELLPEVARILYLDIDTLVVDSLDELWKTDLNRAPLAAVTNVFQHNHRHRPAEIGLPAEQDYFNSGVLLMNLEWMRRERAIDRLRDVAAREGARLEWPDQDALNLVFGRERIALHPRWNCMNSFAFRDARRVFGRRRMREAKSRPAIWHFEGPGENKPWDPRCRHPAREHYLAERAATPWPLS